MLFVYSLILFGLAAICNAIGDTLCYHFDTSIFRKLNPDFWNPQVSWNFCKIVLGYHIDGWHLIKSLMIILITLSVAIAIRSQTTLPIWVIVLLYGVVWNIIFNLFFKFLNK